MNTYLVEVEVLYLYRIEAESERGARAIAQMNVDSHAPHLERTIASICVERPTPEQTAADWATQRPPPGLATQ